MWTQSELRKLNEKSFRQLDTLNLLESIANDVSDYAIGGTGDDCGLQLKHGMVFPSQSLVDAFMESTESMSCLTELDANCVDELTAIRDCIYHAVATARKHAEIMLAHEHNTTEVLASIAEDTFHRCEPWALQMLVCVTKLRKKVTFPNLPSKANGETRRPAYDRDHEWLRWYNAEGEGTYRKPSKIRDKWNALSTEQRKRIAATASNANVTYEVVKKGLATARKERNSNK